MAYPQLRSLALSAGVIALIAAPFACTGASSATPAGSSWLGGNGGAGTAQEGLPCGVAKVMSDYCVSCHNNPPVGGAPMALLSYADLAAPSPLGGTYAGRAVIRMKDMAAPMPPAPGPLASASELSEVEDWVLSGMPKGDCGAGGGSSGTGGSTGAGGAPPQSGIPCDVAAVLVPCLSCHGYPLTGGAPMALVSYGELTATSPKGGTYADRSLLRMTDLVEPMPPAPNPAVPANDVATFQGWITGGLPMGDCGQGGGGGGGPNPYDTPDTCTSNIYWGGGTEDWGQYPKEAMHPGDKCIDCHTNPSAYGLQDKGPKMYLAGTVYPTAHEYDECFGVNGNQTDVRVVITDATNNVVTLKPNVSGNFWIRQNGVPVVFPIHAKVTGNGSERVMTQAVDTGDCNACHTLAGDDNAPGRIMAP